MNVVPIPRRDGDWQAVRAGLAATISKAELPSSSASTSPVVHPSVARTFHDFWELGYRRLVPIVPSDAEVSERSTFARRPGSRGKAVGVRGRDGKWFGFDWTNYEADERDLDRWAAMGAGVGVKTGEQHDGTWLIGVDADCLNPDLAARIEAVVRERLGPVPTRIGRAPKALYVVRLDGPFTYSRDEFDDGSDKEARVEFLSEGRQFVAAGIHPDTRQPYRWPVPLPPYLDLPIVSASELAP